MGRGTFQVPIWFQALIRAFGFQGFVLPGFGSRAPPLREAQDAVPLLRSGIHTCRHGSSGSIGSVARAPSRQEGPAACAGAGHHAAAAEAVAGHHAVAVAAVAGTMRQRWQLWRARGGSGGGHVRWQRWQARAVAAVAATGTGIQGSSGGKSGTRNRCTATQLCHGRNEQRQRRNQTRRKPSDSALNLSIPRV
eukprot:355667-Chlamydomonas_euryale.AAC.3